MNPSRQPPDPAVELGLERLATPQDRGVALSELSDSYSRVLTGGDVPYDDKNRELADREITQAKTSAGSSPVSPASIVEAILFVGHPDNQPISARHMASLMRGVRSSEVELLVQELNELYAETDCPYRIESSGTGYRMKLAEKYDPLRENFYGRIRKAKLSQAAIEVLAIIAYHQPLTKAALKQKCDAVQRRAVSQLVRRGLVTLRPGQQGRASATYETSQRFLEMFGLASLLDLPQPHDIDQQ